MKFKQIDIFGFKSFANKIEVKIDDGIIAIIGPNGCGKSNFADAIRWVLGEQSPKTLRGGSMQDVIFSGTETKKSLSYCEVTLSFSDVHEEGIPYSEISISRRLTRAGDSNYFINNQKVKLRDVHELIRKLSIGKDGYSIIGQGKVEEIISSKPFDRRKIFEEATGVAEARDNKIAAEKKLAATKDNLFNLNNVMIEIEKRLTPLEKDAVKAEKYLAIRDDLRFNEINLYFHEKDAVDVKVKDLTAKLDAANDELTLRNTEKTGLNEKNTKLNDDTLTLENKLKDLTNEKLNLSVDNQKKLGDVDKIKQQVAFVEAQLAEAKQNKQDAEEIISVQGEKLEEYLKEKEILQVDYDKYQLEFDDLDEKSKIANRELQEYNDAFRSSTSKMLNDMSKLADIRANLSEYRTKKFLLQESFDNDTEKLANKKLLYTQKEQELSDFNKSNASFFNRYNDLKNEREENINKRNNLQTQIDDLNEKYNSSNVILSKYDTEHRMLKSMVDSYDGFVYSVKNLIRDAEKNAPLKSKIAGVVANCMKVPEKYEVAISTALGQAVQNIISPTKETSNYLIEYLKERKYGRATFLPMDSYRARELDSRYRNLLKTEGCYGVASELITYEPKYDNIYKGLLGNTVIVNNMQTAIKISKQADINFKIVTIDGDVMNPTGAMTGGSRKNTDNTLISYKRNLKELEENILQETNTLESIAFDRKNKINEINKVKAILASTEKEYSDLSSNVSKNELVLRNKEEAVSNLKDEINELEKNIAKNKEILDDLTASIDNIDAEGSELENNKQDADNQQSLDQEKSKILNKRYTDISQQLALVRTSLSTTKDALFNVNKNIENSQYQIEQAKQILADSDTKIEDQEIIIKNAKNELLTKNLSEEELSKVNEIEDEIKLLEETKEQYREEIFKNSEKIEQNNERINILTSKITKWEGQMETVQQSFAAMSEEIRTKYEALFDNFGLGINQFYVEDYNIEEGKAKIKTFKKQLSAMGDINLKAADDLKTEKAKYDEYLRQKQDVEDSMTQTQEMLKEITEVMTTKFNEGFQKIQENFTKIFSELFGGGRARLILEPSESEDPLDDGIDIEATPPGKSPKRISLLSGGEKALTAISILFSILSLRAMPFCVLDEIEAALDEANVERFARYLRNFSKNTQFIVITHRKPTMQLADSLYGVTMESGSGVSKVLSVTLKDAVENYVEEPKKEKEK